MNIDYTEIDDGKKIIKLRGEMDAQGCIEARPEIESFINTSNCTDLTLDLGQVSFLDSSGVGLIVFLYKRFKSRGGILDIENAQGQPLELMELLRVDKVIPVKIAS